MRKILNTLFIILLLQLAFIESSRKNRSRLRKVKSVSVKDFTDIVEYWKVQLKRFHNVSDQIFDSIANGRNTISSSELKETWNGIFEHSLSYSDKIPNELIEFWFVKDENDSDEVDRSSAYIATQNAIALAVFVNLYSGTPFKAEGQFKEEIESIVQDISAAHVRLDQISKEWFNQADVNGNGEIDLQEFKDAFTPILDDSDDADKVFHEADKSRNGYLEQQEVTHLVAKLLLRHNPYFIINTHQHSSIAHEDVKEHIAGPVQIGQSFLEKKNKKSNSRGKSKN
jgi:hypothetical protein